MFQRSVRNLRLKFFLNEKKCVRKLTIRNETSKILRPKISASNKDCPLRCLRVARKFCGRFILWIGNFFVVCGNKFLQ